MKASCTKRYPRDYNKRNKTVKDPTETKIIGHKFCNSGVEIHRTYNKDDGTLQRTQIRFPKDVFITIHDDNAERVCRELNHLAEKYKIL